MLGVIDYALLINLLPELRKLPVYFWISIESRHLSNTNSINSESGLILQLLETLFYIYRIDYSFRNNVVICRYLSVFDVCVCSTDPHMLLICRRDCQLA